MQKRKPAEKKKAEMTTLWGWVEKAKCHLEAFKIADFLLRQAKVQEQINKVIDRSYLAKNLIDQATT